MEATTQRVPADASWCSVLQELASVFQILTVQCHQYVLLHIPEYLRPLIQRFDLVLREPPHLPRFERIHNEVLRFIDRPRKEEEVHVLVCRLVALFGFRNFFQEHRDGLLQHPAFMRIADEKISLIVTDDLHVQPRFLLAFPPRGFLGRFIRIHVAAGRHPALQTFVPEEERAVPRIEDEGRCSKMAHGEEEKRRGKRGGDEEVVIQSELPMADRPYQGLIAWKEVHALCLRVYQCTKSFPSAEEFGLNSQMRRSAYSVPTNIAEGNGRKTPGDRRRFLDISTGSIEELHYQCILARDLKYITPEECSELHDRIQRTGYLIYKLRSSL